MRIEHATCVAWKGQGVLLTGPSGIGKSDLALRLIKSGAELVADDQVRLHATESGLMASSPENVRGLLEVRGVGLVRFPYSEEAGVAMVVSLLADPKSEPRLPDKCHTIILNIELPLISIYPFYDSAPAKIMTVLEAVAEPGKIVEGAL
jgi:HPr kinase/phosphorylase